ncbi:caspase family protein [Microbacterium allomyrinae]|uniref:Caspase family protein n=1 Tax=Microbacterium allomyrinae TaxID=2830666 RepID=A0A9X1S548_9MICO|nr:caspase family protein [Microbacterium allomyrinae]MCC2033630.1 caspase family protein [Microbacterium allomyrinae]
MPDTTTTRSGFAPSAKQLAALRGHIVHTRDGRLSDTPKARPARIDEFVTTPDDVRRIVTEDLQAFVDAQGGRTVPVLIWAHGGLVSKDAGFETAHHQVDWWKKNGVYPIHMVWESGLLTSLSDVIRGKAPGERGFTDLTDGAIEAIARVIGGRSVWEDMKLDAAAASVDGGGAALLAQELRAFVAANPGAISLHAAGHSAGSIFHSHFVPRLFDGDDPVERIDTVTLLAPAVRLDTFEDTLLPLAESNQIGELSIFTMNDETELKDHTATLYRKSLLYLVSRSFEPEQDAAIAGMARFLTASGKSMRYLGEKPERLVLGPKVWDDRRATLSKSHGDFDNDPPTMESLARRVTQRDDVVDFPRKAREIAPPPAPVPSTPASRAVTLRRRALCIGIDGYPQDPLGGCVADADAWEAALGANGFEVRSLRDGEATREAMLRAMIDLVTGSTPGDILAIQFAGHGTFVPDLDGDETDDLGPSDEALCPVDFREGSLIVDDDLAVIWDLIPEGVSVTLIFDSCHSGTASRGLSRPDLEKVPVPAGTKRRLAPLDADAIAAYRAARSAPISDDLRGAAHRKVVQVEAGRSINTTRVRPDAARREVLIAACQPDEVALETNGHGVFTSAALGVFAASPGLSNRDFVKAVVAAIDGRYDQTPLLTADEARAGLALLSPVVVADGTQPPPAASAAVREPTPAEKRTAAIVSILRATADLLEEGGAE